MELLESSEFMMKFLCLGKTKNKEAIEEEISWITFRGTNLK